MPCVDYESSYSDSSGKLKKQADKLARIACAAMEELERNGVSEVLLLKNDELREWWAKHKEADRIEQERIAEKERRARVKQEALDRLSDEEKELLGLAPKKPSRNVYGKASLSDAEDEDVGEYDYEDWEQLAEEEDAFEVEYHTTTNGITVKTFKVR